MTKQNLDVLIGRWRDDLEQLKGRLESIGDKAETVEYSVLAVQAMSILQCISDLQSVMIEEVE